MDHEFESDVIRRMAVLETKMEMVLDELRHKPEPSGISTRDKALYGGLIAVLTILANIIAALVSKGV